MVRSDESDKKIAEATYNAYEGENRSVSCEVYLEPGTYSVIPKVLAKRCAWKYELRDVVKSYALTRPLKLQQKAKFYDTAHAKPGVKDEDEELQIKKWEERQRKKELKRKTEEDDSMQLELIKLRSYISALHEEMERREKAKVEEQSKDKANENQKQRKKSRGKSKPAAEDNAKGQRGGQQAEAEEAAEEEEEAPEEAENQEEEEEQAEEEEEEDDDDDHDSESDDDDDDDYDDSKDRYLWNPVCVMGLRVYSEDDQIEIKLVEGDEQEEGEEEAEGEEGEEEGEEGEEEEEE